MRALVRAAVAGTMAWVAFAVRFQAPEFHNDHFEHLSMARQVLFGELPGRDFFDPGRPLTVLLSAAGQALSGHSLLGEALLTIGALAVGAAVVFWLASGISRSIAAGALAALLVIAIWPRLYAYPKIFVFAVALLALWKYVDRPTAARAVALGAATVFALLMRHDFGMYVGVVSLCAIAMVRLPPSPLRGFGGPGKADVAAFAVSAAVLVAPYLFWMQQNGLLAASATTGAGSLAGAARLTWRPLHLDLSHGIVHLDPVRGRVTVRWSTATTPGERAALEQRYGLVQAQAEGDATASYGVTDDSRGNIRALVADPRVEDTGGINRGAATLDVPALQRGLSSVGLSRLVVGPFFNAADAEAWLYYLFWLIPAAALGVVALRVKRSGRSPESIKIGAAAVLGVLLNVFLLRGSLDSRLPDVVVPHAIVGAWLLAESARRVRRTPVVWRATAAVVAAVVFVILGSAVSAYGRLTVASLASPPVNGASLKESARLLRRRPIDRWAPPDSDGVPRLTRYVFECTTPEDRLLLVAYEPQVFYYAERLFAGGIEHFHQRRFSSLAEQAKIVATLERQRVPLVIVEDERFRMLQDDYADVLAYVERRFRPVADTTFDAGRRWRIYADRQARPRGTWDGLPCFR